MLTNNNKTQETNIRFHEKVNQFVFGIEKPKKSALSLKRKILQHIHSNNGYTSVYDLMRITSYLKEEIQLILSRLIIDYNGSIIVENNGAVVYYFPEIMLVSRKSASLDATLSYFD